MPPTPPAAPAEPPGSGSREDRRPPLDLAAIEPPTLLARVTAVVGADRRSAVGGVLTAVLVVGLAWVLLRPDPPRSEDLIPLATQSSLAPSPPSTEPVAGPASVVAEPVTAHAAGAVTAPGLYELPSGSRIADLVRAAGGPVPEADLDRLNLAAPVVDGSRVYVPSVGELVLPTPVDATGPGSSPSPGPAGEGSEMDTGTPLVDLNVATLDELDELPGIGPATAQAILDHRAASGGFTAVDELLEVRGIGEAKLADLRDLVTVG